MEFNQSIQILKRALITEKSDRLNQKNKQYFFEVDLRSTKGDVKLAIENLFKVKVAKVRTLVMHGKQKRVGRSEGYCSDWKKAIVTVVKGDTLDLEKI